jgi:SCY1-like protein 1
MPGAFTPTGSGSSPVQTPPVLAPPTKKAPTKSAPTRAPKGKGMALGSKLGTKGKLAGGHADLMAELEKEMKEDEAEVADAWDDDDDNNPFDTGVKDESTQGDLMDVNADQDDWSELGFFLIIHARELTGLLAAFESAPPATTKIQGMPTDESQNAWKAETKPKVPKIKSDNPWQDSAEDLAAAFSSTPNYPTLSTEPILHPKVLKSNSVKSGGSTTSAAISNVPSTWQSPVATPKVDDWGTMGEGDMVAVEEKHMAALSPASTGSPAGGLSGLSKEEKAAEMARRREERKARIAQLKEQKKGGA